MGGFDGSIAIDSSLTGNIGGIAIGQNSTTGGSEAIALEHDTYASGQQIVLGGMQNTVVS